VSIRGPFLRFLCLFAAINAFVLTFATLHLCVSFYSRPFVAGRAVGLAEADPFAVPILAFCLIRVNLRSSAVGVFPFAVQGTPPPFARTKAQSRGPDQ